MRDLTGWHRWLIQFAKSRTVIASEAKQSISPRKEKESVDCFVAALLAMTLS
jgi:hypothetical protein